MLLYAYASAQLQGFGNRRSVRGWQTPQARRRNVTRKPAGRYARGSGGAPYSHFRQRSTWSIAAARPSSDRTHGRFVHGGS